jgi:hypothetical protein
VLREALALERPEEFLKPGGSAEPPAGTTAHAQA